ncbi:MAG: hypothetical protein QM751_14465 [Paludibacteraceae bacterium]
MTLGLNASYIYSKMFVSIVGSLPKYSSLEGASPYLVNTDLSYEYTYKNWSVINSFVLKYFSDRIYTIGVGGFEDVIERSVPTLDFVSTTKVNKHLSFKLKAKNILDPTFEFTRKVTKTGVNQVLHSYRKGVDLSIGISYQF